MKKTLKYLLLILAFVAVYLLASKFDSTLKSSMLSLNSGSQMAQALGIGKYSDLNRLKDELRYLSFAKINLLSAEEEIKELKAILAHTPSNKDFSLARTINSTFNPALSKIDIYVYNDGLDKSKKYIALSPEGFALGFVEFTGARYAKIDLFSEPKKELNATLIFDKKDAPSEKLSVSAVGYTPGSFELFVNKEYPVKEGDVLFYKKYPIANIVKIEKTKQSPFVRAWASLPFPLSVLDYVLVTEL